MENQIATTGQLFPDAAIDQLCGNRLILWHQGQARVGSTADYGGLTYVAAAPSASLEQVLHLPAGIEDFGSLEDLVGELSKGLTSCDVGVDEHATLLLATGIMATWVPECLPGPTVINLWGDVGVERTLLDFMQCVCRRALPLVEPSPRDLARLPTGFTPTLILRHPSERCLRQLVVATGEPEGCILAGGDLVRVHCPIVVSTRDPLNLPALTIPLPPATRALHRITKLDAQRLADRFQPRLLDYRLKHYPNVANAQFDVPGFCPEVRQVARVLGAVLEGSPGLQASIVTALGIVNERYNAERSQTTGAVVLEALLALSHRKAPAAYIGQICDVANSFLEDRDETTQLVPKRVGEILRQELGLVARRRAPGYELALDGSAQRRVHRLAVTYDVLQRVADCPHCQELVDPMPKGSQSAPGAGL